MGSRQEESMCEDVAVTMSLMEMTFPPTFFDIMSHLPMHLVEELFILGPVHVRWTYPTERTMGALKNHVKNRACPEASIAHGYLQDKTMGFVTSYMHNYDVVRTRIWDANPKDSDEYKVPDGGSIHHMLLDGFQDEAHRYVL